MFAVLSHYICSNVSCEDGTTWLHVLRILVHQMKVSQECSFNTDQGSISISYHPAWGCLTRSMSLAAQPTQNSPSSYNYISYDKHIQKIMMLENPSIHNFRHFDLRYRQHLKHFPSPNIIFLNKLSFNRVGNNWLGYKDQSEILDASFKTELAWDFLPAPPIT